MRRTPLPIERECELCGRFMLCARHEVFFGSGNRKKSIRYGMTAYLCPDCHQNGTRAVHRCRETDLMLKERYQRKFKQEHPEESFIKIFGRSYL